MGPAPDSGRAAWICRLFEPGPCRAGAALLAVIGLVEAWAIRAADPDFPLPDLFHGLVLVLLAFFLCAALVPWRLVRIGLISLALGLPLAILFLEVALARADVSSAGDRIARSPDLLLRYTYRPGAVVRGEAPDNPVVTPDGLLDVVRAVPKPAGVDRVVVLGDSVPNDLSIPFERRFPRRLEALLAASAPSGRRAEVVNVSCEGYGTRQEVRLLEKVGLRYQPDLVVVAYVLNDPFLQNGGSRQVGNSYFLFRLPFLASPLMDRGRCSLFTRLHQGYVFDLAVREPLETLRLLSERHGFRVVVATIPLIERFEDPTCLSCYDTALAAAREQGFDTLRLVDGFRGEDYRRYLKPGDPTHPNAEGHERIARQLAGFTAPRLWPAER